MNYDEKAVSHLLSSALKTAAEARLPMLLLNITAGINITNLEWNIEDPLLNKDGNMEVLKEPTMVEIEKMVDTLKLAADKFRLTILLLLREKELCVCEIVEILQTSQPNVSQHMRKLKDGGLVKESKRGQWVYYSLAIDEKPYLADLFKHLPDQKEKIKKQPCEDCCN